MRRVAARKAIAEESDSDEDGSDASTNSIYTCAECGFEGGWHHDIVGSSEFQWRGWDEGAEEMLYGKNGDYVCGKCEHKPKMIDHLDSDSEDTVVVECSRDDITEKTIDGKIYLMEKDDSENLLYDTGTGECVGIYDEENDAVMPLEELDSDSDSD